MTKVGWRARVVMLVVGVTVVGTVAVDGSAARAAPPAGGGSMSGRVVGANGGPLSKICVNANGVGSAISDDNGKYSITGMPAGSYPVQFADCNPNPTYSTQFYLNHFDWGSAEPVSVSDGVDTPLSDEVMQAGVVVTGTVTDAKNASVSGIFVNVNPQGPGQAGGGQTNDRGVYVTQPLPFGGYRVQFNDWNRPALWAVQYWKGQQSWNNATLLTLQASDGSSHAGVDARLSAGADVSGTVKGRDGQRLGGICVSAAIATDNGGYDQVGWSQTGPDGTYTLTGLPPTGVKVDFRDCNSPPSYLESWYGSGGTFDAATTIPLGAGDHHGAVDVQLSAGIAVGGTITDSSGAPIAGVDVNVMPMNNSGQSGWAQTAADGTYLTSPVPPGDYRVQFTAQTPNPLWATQYWKGEQSWDSADALTLSAADDPARLGIDVVLTKDASVSGTVSGPNGAPLSGICVDGAVATGDGSDQIAQSTTASDGTYTLSGLPATAIDVQFQDCNNVGPYVGQSWNNRIGSEPGDIITLVAGQQQTGVDAHLTTAGAISGTVTDTDGAPLSGICVQATTATAFGGLTRSGDDGTYKIDVGGGGDFHVQFVDCSGSPTYSAQYWNGASDPASATAVTLTPGDAAGRIDATLSEGRVSTLSGKLTNTGGAGMTSACAVLYLPDGYDLISRVAANGTYRFDGIPSGTYALAYIGCAPRAKKAGQLGSIPDPTSPETSYPAMWWNGSRSTSTTSATATVPTRSPTTPRW